MDAEAINAELEGIVNSKAGMVAILSDIEGKVLCSAGHFTDKVEDLFPDLAKALLEPTRRMARQLGNSDEAQQASVGDDLHFLFQWLKGDHFLVSVFQQQVDPYNPPDACIHACRKLRHLLHETGGNGTRWWEFWK